MAAISPVEASKPNPLQAAQIERLESYVNEYLKANWPGAGRAEVPLPEAVDFLVERALVADYRQAKWGSAVVRRPPFNRVAKQKLVLSL